LQQTIENVVGNEAGKQLMVSQNLLKYSLIILFQAEAVYLFGVMLIILDLKYDAAARERMIVSYFRYR
jgi:WASH complex subunit strumpellin